MQKPSVHVILVAALLLGCDSETTGLEAVDLEGEWVATSYAFTDRTVIQGSVDLVARDGASFEVTIDSEGRAEMTFDDGSGQLQTATGQLRSWVETIGGEETPKATLSFGARLFHVGRDSDLLILVDPDQFFDLGGNNQPLPVTLRVELLRQSPGS